jgi:hypothetical protein
MLSTERCIMSAVGSYQRSDMVIGGWEQIIAAVILLGLATLAAWQQKKGRGHWFVMARLFQFVGLAWLIALAIIRFLFF